MNAKVAIVGAGKYLPEEKLDNQYFEKIVDTSDDWIVSRTGIKERRRATNETANDLAYLASVDAINSVNYDKNKIDLIIVATITGELRTPSVANDVLRRLEIDHDLMSFDVNAACTGFNYALDIAAKLLEGNKWRSALVIGSEKLTKVVDYEDRNTCVLFGDGAGAVILERTDNKEDEAYFYNSSTPDLKNSLYVDNHIHMQGQHVYVFAVDMMEKSIQRILNVAGKKIENVDLIIPHQANKRIIQTVSKNLEIPLENFTMNMDRYGNTSAASIPITIAEVFATITKPIKALLVGFGGGLTWGSSIINLRR
ncbi:MAG: beta-ketoacyl-ACP synthase III [Acholeplasmataceae bacterium]